MTGPVVSAHEDGDDLIGVPLGSCRHCSCPLVSGDLCPWHKPQPRPARRNRSLASNLALATLRQRGSLTPAELAPILGCSHIKAGGVLWDLAFARKPALAVRTRRALYLPAPEAPHG